MDVSQLTAEAWAFITLAFGTVASGIGFLVKRWSDSRIAVATSAATALATATAAAADAKDRLIEAAERREMDANKRTDAAIAGLATLTSVTNEMSATMKALAEEVRRANANNEYLMRERK